MNAFFLKALFNGQTRRRTWRKMAALLRHGISQRQTLSMLRDRYLARKHPLGRIFTAVLTETEKGHSLDQALAPWIPHEEDMLIHGGVQSGRLPEALQDCADLIEVRTKIFQALFQAISYPILLLGLFLIIILVLAFYVTPQMAQIFDPASLRGAAGALFGFSSFIASPLGLAALIAFLGLLAASIVTLPFWTGPLRLRVEKLPPWSVYRLIVGSVWLYTVATLLRARIQLEYIFVDLLKSGAMRPWLTERVLAIQRRYRTVGSLGAALLHLNMNFPDAELTEELAVFATLPGFETNLYNLAKEWLEEGATRINRQLRLLNVALICGITLMLAGVVMGYGSLLQQFGSVGGF